MKTTSFTQRVQLGFVYVLFGALVAIGQPWSFGLYKIAIVVMMLGGLAQVAVGNVPPDSDAKRFLKLFTILTTSIIGLFLISILLAPILVDLGR